jgi:hypothetical protein
MALFNGLEATIWRHAAWNGGYFGVIFGVRGVLPKAEVSVLLGSCGQCGSDVMNKY